MGFSFTYLLLSQWDIDRCAVVILARHMEPWSVKRMRRWNEGWNRNMGKRESPVYPKLFTAVKMRRFVFDIGILARILSTFVRIVCDSAWLARMFYKQYTSSFAKRPNRSIAMPPGQVRTMLGPLGIRSQRNRRSKLGLGPRHSLLRRSSAECCFM